MQLVTAGEDVLVFYNDRASFQSLVQMMRLERERLDENSALRYADVFVLALLYFILTVTLTFFHYFLLLLLLYFFIFGIKITIVIAIF